MLEIFAGIKYCVSTYFNDIQVIFNIDQNHNNQKEWFFLLMCYLILCPFYQPAIIAKLNIKQNFLALR